MREELVSRSRTLNAASRAIRQAFSARLARSSAPLGFAGAAGRGERGASSSTSTFRDVGDLRGIGAIDQVNQSSVVLKCERMVTTLPVAGGTHYIWLT